MYTFKYYTFYFRGQLDPLDKKENMASPAAQ